jgi:hypothetical protein
MFNPREYITIRYLQENKKTSSGILLSMSNQTMILDQMPKFWTCINDKLSIWLVNDKLSYNLQTNQIYTSSYLLKQLVKAIC